MALTFWILLVTSNTIRFNIKKLYILPTHCIYMFYVDLRQIKIISLWPINLLVFITDRECVYSWVWTKTLNIIQVSLSLQRIWSPCFQGGFSSLEPSQDAGSTTAMCTVPY